MPSVNIEALEDRAQREANAFLKARVFLEGLKRHNNDLTPQQYKTLRGQALAGDIAGAKLGLRRLLEGR